MPRQVNYASAWAHWFGHLLGLGLLAAQQTLQELSWLSLFLPPSPRFYSTSFFFPPYALFLPLLFCFSLPPGVLLPSTPPSFPLLNAPSGGFGYTGMQNSSQSHFSYSLSQGSRARNQSSDVNEALYSLDRVLHGKSAAYKHGSTGRVCWVWCIKHPSAVFAASLNVWNFASLWDPMF